MRQAETLETLRMAQHLAPLLGQGGELRCDLVLSCDADLQDLLGFLPGGQAAQGRQVQGDASRLLRLAHPMALGHPAKRCDGIGTDRQADVIEPECRSGLQLEVKRGAKLLTQRGRGHGGNQRGTLGSGVVRASFDLEHLLARKQPEGIGATPLDEGFAGG